MKYKCPQCGEEHDGWFAIAFKTPHAYNALSEKKKVEIAQINEDLCVIEDDNQTDRFIRAVLYQKVNDHCQDLEYGVWVSLSEASFNDYVKNFHSDSHEAGYFGWLSNQVPGYDDTLRVKTDVVLSKGGLRPVVMIQERNDPNNPFVQDYFNGITKVEAERRLEEVLSRTGLHK